MSKNKTTEKEIKPFKHNKNPVLAGMLFLVKSVYSQWKVLFSITVIFFIIITILATSTFLLEKITNGGDFNGPWSNYYIDNGVIVETSHQLTFFESFWWVFVTISTVGYGDITPVTTLMRTWGILISVIGISFLALYTAVVVNGFTQEFQKRANPEQFDDVMSNEVQELKIKELTDKNIKLQKELENLKQAYASKGNDSQ